MNLWLLEQGEINDGSAYRRIEVRTDPTEYANVGEEQAAARAFAEQYARDKSDTSAGKWLTAAHSSINSLMDGDPGVVLSTVDGG